METAELKGKTVGIIGMGNIAKRLVELLKPFKVNILYYNLFHETPDYEQENNIHFNGLNDVIEKSEILTIHCALTDETRNLINKNSLEKMKNGAILINTARGECVDPYAVANALKSGKLAYAALDVHLKEPIPEDYPLLNIENVILTPHIAGITADSFRKMMHDAFRNIECFEQGRLDEIEFYRYL